MSPIRSIKPPFWDLPAGDDGLKMNYRRMWQSSFVAAALITLAPVLVLTLYCRYRAGLLWPELLPVLAVIVPLLLLAVFVGTMRQVTRLYQLDLYRANILREIVYTHKMAAIGRLAAGVAHEINNPMAVLREKAGLIQDLIQRDGDDCDKEKILKLVQGIQDSSKRASSITHRLLSFGRQIRTEVEELDLGRVVRDVAGLFTEKTKFRGIEVVIDEDPEIPPVRSDRSLIEQFLFNLLDNAFSAVGDGGAIRIGLRGPKKEMVTLSVEDDGPGIAEDDLKHIFEPFFSTGGVRNTGLGLSITYGIVHRLSGRIRAESPPGQGARFTVTLPLSCSLEKPDGTEDEITRRALNAKGAGD